MIPHIGNQPEKRQVSLQGYQIYCGNVLMDLKQLVEATQASRILVLADRITEEHCLPLIKEVISPDATIVISPGEKNKTLDTSEKIWQRLFDLKADRHSLLLNLGGGVIGDIGGFCAGTFMRGIPFIQVPTTLLSMVDSSIGGKLGIDFYGLKNSIGLFKDPLAVFVDPRFLKTLPLKELRSGFAEMLKHGLIRDKSIWDALTTMKPWSDQPWEDAIFASLLVKKEVVQADPLENGLRKILNFGHTIGHALESLLLDSDKPLLHGEAVAAGMIMEAYISSKYHTLPAQELQSITDHLLAIYGKAEIKDLPIGNIVAKMSSDKKNRGQTIRLALLDFIGQASVDHPVSATEIRESAEYYQAL